MHHVAYGIHGRHLLLYDTFLVVKQLDGVWLVEIVVYGVGIVRELSRQVLVHGLSLGYALYESRYHLVVLVLPRVLFAPMVSEVALHYTHLFVCSLLRILLHT